MKRAALVLATFVALIVPAFGQQMLAFVDVERCLKEYKKAVTLSDQIKTQVDEKVRSLTEDRRKIAALKETLDLYTKGSEPWIEQQKKIRLAEAEADLEEASITYKTSKTLATELSKLYDDVRREVKAVAEAKGCKAVFMYVSGSIEGDNKRDVMNNIMVRPVLFYVPDWDITSDVVARLNK